MGADQPPPPRIPVMGDVQGQQRRTARGGQADLQPPDLMIDQPGTPSTFDPALLHPPLAPLVPTHRLSGHHIPPPLPHQIPRHPVTVAFDSHRLREHSHPCRRPFMCPVLIVAPPRVADGGGRSAAVRSTRASGKERHNEEPGLTGRRWEAPSPRDTMSTGGHANHRPPPPHGPITASIPPPTCPSTGKGRRHRDPPCLGPRRLGHSAGPNRRRCRYGQGEGCGSSPLSRSAGRGGRPGVIADGFGTCPFLPVRSTGRRTGDWRTGSRC